MPDRLDIALDNAWVNYICRAEEVARLLDPLRIIVPVSKREDAKLAFKRQVREAIELAGYVSGEKHFNDCMAAKKSG